jgi:ferredoxin--NADP+ reductase
VTREPFRNMGRITDLIESGKLFERPRRAALDPAEDRVMICGSPAMLRDLKGTCSKSAASRKATPRRRVTSSSSARSSSSDPATAPPVAR